MPDDMRANTTPVGDTPTLRLTDLLPRFSVARFPIVEIIEGIRVWAVPEDMLEDVRKYAAGPESLFKHPFLVTTELHVALTTLRRWLSYNGWVRHVDPRDRRSPWGARFHAKPGGQELCIPVPAVDRQQAHMANHIIRHWRMLRRGEVRPPYSQSIGLQFEGPDLFDPLADPEKLENVPPGFLKLLCGRLIIEHMIEEAECENPFARRDGGPREDRESAGFYRAPENQVAASQ